MDQLAVRTRPAAATAIDVIGSALMSDAAVRRSAAEEHAFSFNVDEGRLHAFAIEGDTVRRYSVHSCAITVMDQLLELRFAEPTPWDAAILRLDRSAPRLTMDRFYGAEARRLDPSISSTEVLAEAILSLH